MMSPTHVGDDSCILHDPVTCPADSSFNPVSGLTENLGPAVQVAVRSRYADCTRTGLSTRMGSDRWREWLAAPTSPSPWSHVTPGGVHET